MELQTYTGKYIDSFLLNYTIFVHDLPELAEDWSTFDPEEQSDYRSELMQVWGNRKVLGALFRAKRLPDQQVDEMATLDRMLLQQAPMMKQCFDMELGQLLAIFRWGSPLVESRQPVAVEVEPAFLNQMALSFA